MRGRERRPGAGPQAQLRFIGSLLGFSPRATLQPEPPWQDIVSLAERHDLAPLLHRALILSGEAARGGVPRPILTRTEKAWRAAAARNLLLSREGGRVLECLGRAGLQAIVWKGPWLAEELYGDPGARVVSDIDIIVREMDLERALAILAGHGYRPVAPPESRGGAARILPPAARATFGFDIELERRAGGSTVRLDVHWTLAGPDRFLLPGEVLWAEVKPAPGHGCGYRLSPEMTLAGLILHSHHHGFLPRALLDAAAFSQRNAAHLDRRHFLGLVRSIGMRRATALSAAIAEHLFGCTTIPSPRAPMARVLARHLASRLAACPLPPRAALLAALATLDGPRRTLRACAAIAFPRSAVVRWRRGLPEGDHPLSRNWTYPLALLLRGARRGPEP